MSDLEKLIKGLESLRDICNAKSDMAIGEGKVAWAGYANTADDALALLKAQEPRVMTLEEVKQAKGSDIWLELSGNIAEDVLTAATIEGCGTGGICTRYESLNYGKYCVKPYGWRIWTARPTEEQRKAVRWNE